ncbi:MAG: TrkH family potassium uptake protein [Oscillospiraceae bacterium]|nr:TrkH family potassium uptake protein [Oscillospiraceae bacterium]
MNLRMISNLIGKILLIELIALAPPAAISLYYQETDALKAFLITMIVLAAVGFLLCSARPKVRAFYAAEGFVVTALSWLVISVFGALPFYLSGAIPSPVDAFFEVVSGFTTTGASILSDIEALPMGLLYWRSFTHWLGGMGVLVFLLAITSFGDGEGHSLHLLRAESPGPDVGKITPKLRQGALMLYVIYIALSVIEVIFLLCGGMPLFDSLCTMFGTAGTGGFSIKNASMAAYPSVYLQNVVTVFMALFGVNFSVFFLLLMRDFSQALRDEELRCYLGIMVGSIALITLNIHSQYQSWETALHHAAFQVSSIMTTTGYATVDFNNWPEFSRTILIILMFVGASAGSTGGGMKVSRLVICFKAAAKEISRMLHPKAVRVIRLNCKALDTRVIRRVNVFMTVYFFTVALSFLILSIDNFGMVTNFTAVVSCLNNIGPGLELVGPTGNYSHFSNLSKLILAVDMLLGRLEFFPLLILFSPSTWRRRKQPAVQ